MKYDQVTSLLSKAKNFGITIFEEQGKLKIKAAKDRTIDPSIIQEIKDYKQEIIDFLKDGFDGGRRINAQEDKIQPTVRSNGDRIPLSYSQEQLWLIDQLEGSVQYHQPTALRLRKELDIRNLEAALLDLITRHEVLRTVFKSEEGKPYQMVLPVDEWKMQYNEGSAFEEEAYLNTFIKELFLRPFDLAKDYLLRANLIKCGPDDHVLVIVMHHIVSDGWSKSILVKDLIELYSSRIENRAAMLPQLPIQYADYATWQRKNFSVEVMESHLKWWEEQLKGVEILELPTDFPRTAKQSYRGDNLQVKINKTLTDELKALALRSDSTLFMVMLAAYKVLLYRYSGQEDICVGTPLANRNRQEVESMVGYFINTLTLRSNLNGNASFSAVLDQVKSKTISAYGHQEVPFEKIVNRIGSDRSLSRNPLFQVFFALHNTPDIPTLELGDLTLESMSVGTNTTYFDLTFSLVENQQGLVLDILYCGDLFISERIARMGEHYRVLLSSIIENPDQGIDELRMVSPQEAQKLLFEFNDTAVSYPKEKSLVHQFDQQVSRHPDQPALVFEGEHLTYRELQEKANQLAHYLRESGVQFGDKVGILCYRGFDMIIALWGVLKSGATYVPLNIDYPTSRLVYILEDAAVQHIVYSHPELLGTSGLTGYQFLKVEVSQQYPKSQPDFQVTVDSPAYVMYTSGTTGEPKGTLVSQLNILKLAYEPEIINIQPQDKVLQWSNFAFDGSTYEIFNTLLSGASLYLITEADAPDPKRLASVMINNNLSIAFITTALFNAFVDFDVKALKGLRKLLFGGELVSPYHVKRALAVLGPDKIIHMYGPTETTTYATYFPIQDCEHDRVPIGRPLTNTTIYIVNNGGKPAGIGLVGEIWIGGDGVSLGYLNRKELTDEKFIQNPFIADAGGYLYKTGDLARWLPDGNIEFVGRKDTQVKIRGYRIELGEVESVLQQSSLVRQCVVVTQKDPSGTLRLAAYIVPEGLYDKSRIQQDIRTELPDYMIPTLMMEIDKIPLNPNGKIDKNALPEIEVQAASMPKVANALASTLQQKITAIWEDLLAFKPIGEEDDFFDLGGHSLLASRVVSSIRKELGIEIDMIDVFKNPTVALLTNFVAEKENSSDNSLESELTDIWKTLLDLETLGVEDDFFDLGGHSLLASRVVSAVRKKMDVEIDMIDVFKNPTVSELAAFIGTKKPVKAMLSFENLQRPANIPLSYAQERLWFIDQYEGSTHYHIPQLLKLKGDLSVVNLEKAFIELVNRHEVLRTAYVADQGVPYQQILKAENWNLKVVDWNNLNTDLSLEHWIGDLMVQPFDLSSDYALKVFLVKKTEKENHLLILLHHIAADGWSMPILIQEIVELYDALATNRDPRLAPLPIQYADYAIWQRNYLTESQLEEQLNYWGEKLGGVSPLQLPLDFARSPIRSTRGASLHHLLPEALQAELTSLCKQEEVTLFMLLLAAFKILLYKYTGQEDICVGTPMANRTLKETETLIGYFINTLALRDDLSGQPTFREFLNRVKSTSLEAYSRQEVPFEKIVERVVDERDPSRSPVFEVLFALQNTPDSGKASDVAEIKLDQLQIIPENLGSASSKFDLAVTVAEIPSGFIFNAIYASDLFRKESIETMMTHFENVLAQLRDNFDQPISEIQLLTPKEEQELIQKFNQTSVDYARPKTLLGQFEAQVLLTPGSIAVEMDTATLTYAELDSKANQWAHFLQKRGVKPGHIVGIAVERSFDMIIGILAIYKAGAAYLPIDPRYPATRVAYLLKDAKIAHTLSHIQHQDIFQDNDSTERIYMDTVEEEVNAQPTTSTGISLHPTDVAYVIYTSGSTGNPKGVVMEQGAVTNQGHWAQDFFDLSSEDAVLQRTTFCFDPSVWEFFWPLSVGGRICFAKPNMEGDSRYLIETIEARELTIVCLVPSMLSVFLQDVQLGNCPSLKRIICGGEILKKTQLEICKAKLPHVQVYNIYGPTETAIHVTCFKIPENLDALTSIPIGKPLSNVQIYMLDDGGQLVPEGVVGELCVGGVQLARGYLNQPLLTSEKFIIPQFNSNGVSRLYRTGDLARWLPDGTIEYIGRKDNQLKINGFRVELGEVEHLLNQMSAVKQAIVLAKKDDQGNNRLVAYVVPEGAFDRKNLEKQLKSVSPAYMVPSFWIPLEKIPLNSTGKVNYQALPEPDISALIKKSYVAPSNEAEQKLAEIWKSLLQLKEVGIRDNFFEIGGHSLLATRLISGILNVFQQRLKVGDIFTYPIIESLATYLDTLGAPSTEAPLVAVNPKPARVPLSFSQERLWFVDQLGGSTQFHLPTVLRLKNELDRSALEKALRNLVNRHEVLRTVIESDEGLGHQVLRSADDWQMGYTELGVVAQKDSLEDLVISQIKKPFDLSQDYMLRAHLIGCGDHDHVLILVLHHIAADGWSISLLVKDLVEFYSAEKEKRPVILPKLPIQYADYALWQRKYYSGEALADHLDWWAQQLKGVQTLDLPTDFPRPEKPNSQGASFSLQIDQQLTNQLRAFSLESESTLFMTLLAVFKVLLHRYSGQDDICVGTSLANRNRKELESLVGFFINSLVLRSDLGGNPTFRKLLQEIKSNTLSAFAHQEVSFEQIVDRVVAADRDLSRSPIFQVLFTLQNAPEVPSLELGDLNLSPEPLTAQNALYELSFYLTENSRGLQVGIVYRTDLFSQATIEQMATHFQLLIQSVLTNPDQEIDQLSMLTEAEERSMLNGLLAEDLEPEEKTLVDLFEEQVARTPGNVALVFEGQEWTYGVLNNKANQLAQYLQKNYAVQADDLFGLMIDASPWSLLGMMAILKSGGAYVPIDIDFPKERIGFILKDTGIKALLVKSEQFPDLGDLSMDLLEVDTISKTLENQGFTENIRRAKDPAQLAYVIYTSGSTGQSKGVMVTHRNLTDYFYGLLDKVDIQSSQSFGLMSTMSADLGNTVLFGALLTGGTLHLFSKKSLRDAEFMQAYFQNNAIDCIKIVPAHWKALEIESGILLPNRTLIFGGEALSVGVIEKIKAVNPALEVINHYGPTETTIGKLLHRVNLAASYTTIPIGRPFSKTKIYIVNPNLGLCPPGVAGELLIGGEGVARGYLKRPELTTEKFIESPFAKGKSQRLYRTGDLVRQLPDGNIEFIGRKDDQVKIRGYRVELGEIESVLRTADTVSNAVVLARADEQGELRLQAYVVADGNFNKEQVQDYLGTKLPDYMVPGLWMELDALPLTSNGKVDKKSLPDPDISTQSAKSYVAPRTETEQILANIWKRLLKLDQVGIHDHFFEIGGHSLLAIRIISAIRKELKQKPDLEDIFTYPTIETLGRFLDGGQEEATSFPLIAEWPRPERIPLSFAQERLWFIDQFAGSIQYHMPTVLRLGSELDQGSLERAFSDLINRHEILRTSYQADDGQPYQVIMPVDQWQMTYSDDPAFAEETYLRQFISAEVNRPFDLSKDYMLRAHLVKCGDLDHVLIIVMHHIATDGWSTALLVQDLMAFYKAGQENREPQLVELPIQYADYAIWQRKHLSGEQLASQLEWWEQKLADVEPLNLPTDYSRPAVQSTRGASIELLVDKELTAQLNALSRKSDATLFMTLISAFKVLMHRYSGQDDICIGAPLANRNHKEVEPLVGCFLNALILRSDLAGNPEFSTLLGQVKANMLAAFARQEVPFEQIVDRVESDRSLSRSPIFQVLFSMRNTPEVPNLELGDLSLSSEPTGHNISQLDLAFYVTESPTGLRIVILYCSDLFTKPSIERMAGHFQTLLSAIVTNPTQTIGQLPLLTAQEERQLIVDFNDTAISFPEGKTIIDYFEEQVVKRPDQLAVVFKGQKLTYQELNQQADQLAGYLKTTYDLQADDLVGIMIQRSDWAVVAMLAILKAGAAYVPIDVSYPKERQAFLIEDTKIKTLIVHSDNLYNIILGGFNVNVFAIDLQMKVLESEGLTPIVKNRIKSSDLAYVIYTSGSTGEPKGVMVEHGGIMNTIISQKREFGVEYTDNCLQFFSFSFDASGLDLYTTLLSGATLFIVDEETKSDPGKLVHYMQENSISVATLPASYLRELNVKELSGLRTLITGGESPAVEKVTHFLEFGQYINSYGPTETSICATAFKVNSDAEIPNGHVPLGRPIANTQLYITDRLGQLVPQGIIGELCIAGAGLARGYLNNDDLTKERFILNPFLKEKGARLYKTGDLARWSAEGNLEFLGRGDDQVKIRGYRIEPGEIENILSSSPEVKASIVVAKTIAEGDVRLVAYVLPEKEFDKVSIQNFLSSRLPDYMIPALWVALETFPLTATGKIDKKALPEPDLSLQSGQEYVAPRNEMEESLARIWQELLHVDQIGVYDNFFLLGGHSLLAIRVLSAVKEEFSLNIPLKVIFEFPTIDELQKYIRLMQGNKDQGDAFQEFEL